MGAASGCVLLRSATTSDQRTSTFALDESMVADVAIELVDLHGKDLV